MISISDPSFFIAACSPSPEVILAYEGPEMDPKEVARVLLTSCKVAINFTPLSVSKDSKFKSPESYSNRLYPSGLVEYHLIPGDYEIKANGRNMPEMNPKLFGSQTIRKYLEAGHVYNIEVHPSFFPDNQNKINYFMRVVDQQME